MKLSRIKTEESPKVKLNLKMEFNTKDNGGMASEMVKESKSGPMAQFTKALGTTTKQTEKVKSSMPMETSMMVCGLPIRLMEKELTTTQTVPSIKENLFRTISTDLVLNPGQMALSMKENI